MQRIQRQRTKGWKMPANAVYVGRPSKWGNPYPISAFGREGSLSMFKGYLEETAAYDPHFLDELKGKNLACWCPLDQPCHADIIIEYLKSHADPSAQPKGACSQAGSFQSRAGGSDIILTHR